jgi:hypothetical protein
MSRCSRATSSAGRSPGRGPEHNHRPGHRVEPRGKGVDLLPRLERPLLRKTPQRLRHAASRRVDVDQPRHGGVEDLPQRLRRLEPMPLRKRAAPGADLLRPKIGDQLITEPGVAFESNQRSFSIVDGAA